MLSKARIKLINQLKQKKHRDAYGLFIAEGHRNVTDFLNSNMKLEYLYAVESWFLKSGVHEDDKHFITDTISLSKITALKTPPEVVAVFKTPEQSDFIPDYNKLYLALDDIHDPGNMGTIIRTADWFGITEILCSQNTVDYLNPKVVQATMGSLARVKIKYCDLEETLHQTKNKMPVYGAFLNGEPVTKLKSTSNGIIVIGSEAHGISEKVEKHITTRITIPSFAIDKDSHAESLNASIATAIICYAFKSQH